MTSSSRVLEIINPAVQNANKASVFIASKKKMHSLQDLPFEVVQKIVENIDRKYKLHSLILCKSFYQPCLESLYHHVTITHLDQFRSFLLAITHHRHQPNLHVKRLDLDISDLWSLNYVIPESYERPMMFTEFELLARHCINLTQLHFPNSMFRCWKFLQELDLQKFWPRLVKLPPLIHYNSSFQVYQDMANRLVQLDISGPFRISINLEKLIPHMRNLETVIINDMQVTLDTNFVYHLSNTHPHLRHLNLWTTLKTASNSSSIDTTTAALKTLICEIDRLDSTWFSLFNTIYRNTDSLTMTVRAPGREEEIIAPILYTIQSTNIKQLKSIFRNLKDFASFAENLVLETVYGYDVWDQSSSSTISLNLNYQDYLHRLRNKLVSQFSRRKNKIATHEFTLDCEVDKEIDYNPITYLSKHILKKPIHLQLTRMTLTRNYKLHANMLGDSRKYCYTRSVFLDSALDYFPNLEYLTIAFDLETEDSPLKIGWTIIPLPKYNVDFNFQKVTLSSNKPAIIPQHYSLRYLKIKSSTIDRSVYYYLFKKCPNLSILCIQDCRLKDDETLIALEYLCLEHNVELLYFK
jgi:hypothetical protein